MTHYIYTHSNGFNEVIEATIEKPLTRNYNLGYGHNQSDLYKKDIIYYSEHLSTAKRYPIEGKIPDWKEGDELIEGKDFEKQHQLKWNDGWEYECKSVWDKVHDCGDKRIVAISIYQSQCTCNFVTEYLKCKADCPVHDIEDSGGMVPDIHKHTRHIPISDKDIDMEGVDHCAGLRKKLREANMEINRLNKLLNP